MRISYNWLKELLPSLQHSPAEVADLLTLHSFETVVAGKLEIDLGIKIVRITNIEKHPNADRLRMATVTDGTSEFTVVCGAPNIEIGQVVPYSPPGATVKDAEGNDFVVRKAKIRGVESPGMLNSLRELGLHQKEHGGIWVLPSDLPLGTALADHVPADTILEADITPNRAHDCLSHVGVAREVAALLRITVKEPQLADLPKQQGDLQVTIENAADCPRYLAAEISGVKIAPSPMWLQVRLLASGGKPKNNLVDITNYVMFEIGNPTHLFDAAHIPDKTISVRRAQNGEVVSALDEVEYNLTTEDVVIASGNKPVAIAGVMGGLESGIQNDTENLLLEVANFRPYLIQETSRRLNLRSESSTRFSKGIHPSQVEVAARRSLQLLQEVADASIGGTVDVYPQPYDPRIISFRPNQPSRIAGIPIAHDEVSDILRRLRCEVSDAGEVWEVTVPADRLDLEGEHDLVEEVVRLVGLTTIPAKKSEDMSEVPIPGEIFLRDRLRHNLVALGFTETYNYSFEPVAYAVIAGLDSQSHLTLTNPPAPDLANLRVSLLPGLLANLVTNRTVFQRNVGRKESALFEIGNVYRAGNNGRVAGVEEETYVGGAIVGGVPSDEAIIQAIADAYEIEPEVVKKVGAVRLLERDVQQKLKYRLPITVFECNLSQLVLHSGEKEGMLPSSLGEAAQQSAAVQFVPYSKYPSVVRDISMLVNPSISVDAVQEIIERVGGELVVDVDLFDEYQPSLATGEATASAPEMARKALAFHVEYQANDRTLTDDEVAKLQDQIVAALQKELSAEIR